MRLRFAFPLAFLLVLMGGCAQMEKIGGPQYGETSGTVSADRNGTITQIESVKVDKDLKPGVGTAVGAVAGAILGGGIGDSTTGAVVGGVVGGVAGTYAESKLSKQNAQEVTVKMSTGGTVTITQPIDNRLSNGMAVRVEGSGKDARVVPR